MRSKDERVVSYGKIKQGPAKQERDERFKVTAKQIGPQCVHVGALSLMANLESSEYMKDHNLNCGERYKDMIDHRSYAHNLSSCEIKA